MHRANRQNLAETPLQSVPIPQTATSAAVGLLQAMPYESIKPVAALAVGTVTPLALTLGGREPAALLAGVVLAGCLIKMTFNPSGGPPASYDKAAEERAIKNVSMTSDGNRLVRLLLGSVYIYAAWTFAVWMTGASGDTSLKLLPKLYAGELGAFGSLGLTWIGSFVDLFIAGVWLSSGWCGQ